MECPILNLINIYCITSTYQTLINQFFQCSKVFFSEVPMFFKHMENLYLNKQFLCMEDFSRPFCHKTVKFTAWESSSTICQKNLALFLPKSNSSYNKNIVLFFSFFFSQPVKISNLQPYWKVSFHLYIAISEV